MYQTSTLKTERSGALDLLRFMAVLIVFIAHFTDAFNYRYHIVPENFKWNPLTRYAPVIVTLFFMISSYVITMTSMHRNIKDFFITRLSRIYPLFWVSCIVAFMLPRFLGEHTYLMYSHSRLFVANMTMVPQLFGYDSINPVYWTLLVELFFYFFIALVILLNGWNKILIVIAFFLACTIGGAVTHTGFLNMFLPFIAGMLFYFIKIKFKNRHVLYFLLGVTYLCQLQACVKLSFEYAEVYHHQILVSAWVLGGIITFIYLLFYRLTVLPSLVKDTPATRFLGEITYSFYLFHIYFLYLYWYLRNRIQHDLLLLGMLLLIILLSWALRVWVEKPLNQLTKTLLYSTVNLFGMKQVLAGK